MNDVSIHTWHKEGLSPFLIPQPQLALEESILMAGVQMHWPGAGESGGDASADTGRKQRLGESKQSGKLGRVTQKNPLTFPLFFLL